MTKKLTFPQIACLYYFMIRAGFLGFSSSIILHLARQDGWIALLLGIGFGILPLLLFFKLSELRPHENILEMVAFTFGRKLSKVIQLFLIVSVFGVVCLVFYDLIIFITSQYLNQTPVWAVAIMFFIPLTYILNKGLPIIVRAHVILVYISILLFLLSISGLIGQSSFDNVKPILEFGWFPILKGGLSFVSVNVLPLFLLLIIPRDFIHIQKNYKLKITGVYFIACFTLFLVLYLILSIFGVDLALLYQYPEYHLLKTINIGGFISRVEGILAIQWLIDMFAFLVVGVYFISQYFKTNWNFQCKQMNFAMIMICVLLVLVVSHLFKNNTLANTFLLHYFSFLSYTVFLLVPFLIYIFCKRKTRG